MADNIVLEKLLEDVLELSLKAGEAILGVYSSEDFGVTYKHGGSPLTKADEAAEAVIEEGLKRIAPGVPLLSEEAEGEGYDVRRDWKRLWIVDPLDGTKEFIKRNGEFTVNIALVEDGFPVLGVVHAPALGLTYAAAKGRGAERIKGGKRERVRASAFGGGKLKVVASRSHASPEGARFMEALGSDIELVNMGSSLKFCIVAEGGAHLYPRYGPTMEWDTAAAQCVAEEAGAAVTTLGGQRLSYNRDNLLNPFFMVSAPGVDWAVAVSHCGPEVSK